MTKKEEEVNERQEEEEEYGRKSRNEASVAVPSDLGVFAWQSVIKERDGDLHHPTSTMTSSPNTSASSYGNEGISGSLNEPPCFFLPHFHSDFKSQEVDKSLYT